MKIVIRAMWAIGLLGLVLIEDAAACACCTDLGDRFESREVLSDYTRDELLSIRLAPTATLYADAGFPGSVKGVAKPQAGDYLITWSTTNSQLLLTVTDPSKAPGTISFTVPRRIYNLAFDPQKGPARPNGPKLYREWRIEGDATLTGIFAAKRARAKVHLILQGEGNRCVTATDFKSWSLSLTAPGVAVKLLGKTVQP